MPYLNLEPASKQLTILIGLGVVTMMSFGLAHSYYQNALFDQTLKNIQQQNSDLRGQIENGYRELEYYKSAQYKDKYAKENLGLVRPGEKALIITSQNAVVSLPVESASITPSEQQEAMYLELLRQMPIVEHWKLYLFHKDRIEGLKFAL